MSAKMGVLFVFICLISCFCEGNPYRRIRPICTYGRCIENPFIKNFQNNLENEERWNYFNKVFGEFTFPYRDINAGNFEITRPLTVYNPNTFEWIPPQTQSQFHTQTHIPAVYSPTAINPTNVEWKPWYFESEQTPQVLYSSPLYESEQTPQVLYSSPLYESEQTPQVLYSSPLYETLSPIANAAEYSASLNPFLSVYHSTIPLQNNGYFNKNIYSPVKSHIVTESVQVPKITEKEKQYTGTSHVLPSYSSNSNSKYTSPQADEHPEVNGIIKNVLQSNNSTISGAHLNNNSKLSNEGSSLQVPNTSSVSPHQLLDDTKHYNEGSNSINGVNIELHSIDVEEVNGIENVTSHENNTSKINSNFSNDNKYSVTENLDEGALFEASTPQFSKTIQNISHTFTKKESSSNIDQLSIQFIDQSTTNDYNEEILTDYSGHVRINNDSVIKETTVNSAETSTSQIGEETEDSFQEETIYKNFGNYPGIETTNYDVTISTTDKVKDGETSKYGVTEEVHLKLDSVYENPQNILDKNNVQLSENKNSSILSTISNSTLENTLKMVYPSSIANYNKVVITENTEFSKANNDEMSILQNKEEISNSTNFNNTNNYSGDQTTSNDFKYYTTSEKSIDYQTQALNVKEHYEIEPVNSKLDSVNSNNDPSKSYQELSEHNDSLQPPFISNPIYKDDSLQVEERTIINSNNGISADNSENININRSIFGTNIDASEEPSHITLRNFKPSFAEPSGTPLAIKTVGTFQEKTTHPNIGSYSNFEKTTIYDLNLLYTTSERTDTGIYDLAPSSAITSNEKEYYGNEEIDSKSDIFYSYNYPNNYTDDQSVTFNDLKNEKISGKIGNYHTQVYNNNKYDGNEPIISNHDYANQVIYSDPNKNYPESVEYNNISEIPTTSNNFIYKDNFQPVEKTTITNYEDRNFTGFSAYLNENNSSKPVNTHAKEETSGVTFKYNSAEHSKTAFSENNFDTFQLVTAHENNFKNYPIVEKTIYDIESSKMSENPRVYQTPHPTPISNERGYDTTEKVDLTGEPTSIYDLNYHKTLRKNYNHLGPAIIDEEYGVTESVNSVLDFTNQVIRNIPNKNYLHNDSSEQSTSGKISVYSDDFLPADQINSTSYKEENIIDHSDPLIMTYFINGERIKANSGDTFAVMYNRETGNSIPQLTMENNYVSTYSYPGNQTTLSDLKFSTASEKISDGQTLCPTLPSDGKECDMSSEVHSKSESVNQMTSNDPNKYYHESSQLIGTPELSTTGGNITSTYNFQPVDQTTVNSYSKEIFTDDSDHYKMILHANNSTNKNSGERSQAEFHGTDFDGFKNLNADKNMEFTYRYPPGETPFYSLKQSENSKNDQSNSSVKNNNELTDQFNSETVPGNSIDTSDGNFKYTSFNPKINSSIFIKEAENKTKNIFVRHGGNDEISTLSFQENLLEKNDSATRWQTSNSNFKNIEKTLNENQGHTIKRKRRSYKSTQSEDVKKDTSNFNPLKQSDTASVSYLLKDETEINEQGDDSTVNDNQPSYEYEDYNDEKDQGHLKINNDERENENNSGWAYNDNGPSILELISSNFRSRIM